MAFRYGLTAAAAGEVEKDCEEMEVRRWIVRNALFEGRKDNIVNSKCRTLLSNSILVLVL